MSTPQRQALIVEGGGMRGAFTAGVLDAFLEKQFNPFDLYVGVSSGSTNLANYLAGQHGRTLQFYIDHSLRPEFISYKRFLKGGDLIDLEWMWQVGEAERPLDQQVLFAQNPDFYMVLTHARSGRAEYLRAGKDNLLSALRASSTIPVLTRQPVDIMGEPYFDGGVADALPVQWAAQQHDVNALMVIRTRPQHYAKTSSKGDQFLAKYMLKHHHGFASSLQARCLRYNDSVNFLRQPNEQRILEVCVPNKKGLASRLCKDRKKLEYTYRVGQETGYAAMEAWQSLK